jgi:hypothetical protein
MSGSLGNVRVEAREASHWENNGTIDYLSC